MIPRAIAELVTRVAHVFFPPRGPLMFERGDPSTRLEDRRRAEAPTAVCILVSIVVGTQLFWDEELLVAGIGLRRRGSSSVERRGLLQASLMGSDNAPSRIAGKTPSVPNDQ